MVYLLILHWAKKKYYIRYMSKFNMDFKRMSKLVDKINSSKSLSLREVNNGL